MCGMVVRYCTGFYGTVGCCKVWYGMVYGMERYRMERHGTDDMVCYGIIAPEESGGR